MTSLHRPLVPHSVSLSLMLFSALLYSPVQLALAEEQPKLPAPAASDALVQARSLSTIFERVALTITPSVVNITASQKAKPQKRRGLNRNDPSLDPFREYFGNDLFERFFPDQQEGGGGQPAFGTGVIIDTDGHILTNNHVIGEADDITVRLSDERTFKAEVIGRDERTDIAVIKIKAPKLAAATLGNSDQLKIGEWVIASGNPFGLDNTITAGIVSAKGRSIMGGNQYEDFIQTDAAINPGNSGGPLVNLDGQVVGINTAIFSRSGGYMGIGFAIPINMARLVFESLISSGKVVRGWLGVGIQNLSEDLSKSFKYSNSEGALVGHVEPNGPAAQAGIKQGDIIVSLNGETMHNINQLRNYVASLKPGKSIPAEIFRDGKKISLEVKVKELPSAPKALERLQKTKSTELGMSLEPLTEQIAQELGTSRTTGVVVTRVQPGSIAAKSGILMRDVIVSIDGQEVSNPDDVKELLADEAIKDGVRFVVETQGMQRFVFIQSNDAEADQVDETEVE